MQFILFFICQCFWIGFHRKRKTLDSILCLTARRRRKNRAKRFNKRKMNTCSYGAQTYTHNASVCTHHINTDTISIKCAQWILNLQFFFINFFALTLQKFWRVQVKKKLKNFNVYARVRWNGVNQFQHMYVLCMHAWFICSGKKNISLWISFIMTCKKYASVKKWHILEGIFITQSFRWVFFNFKQANDKDRCIDDIVSETQNLPAYWMYIWTII